MFYHLSTCRRGKCQNSSSRLFPACTKREGVEKRKRWGVSDVKSPTRQSLSVVWVGVVLWLVQCSLHRGCAGGSAGGVLAAGGMSAGISGSWAVCGPSFQEQSWRTWTHSPAALRKHTQTHTEILYKSSNMWETLFFLNSRNSLGSENHLGRTNPVEIWHQRGDIQTAACWHSSPLNKPLVWDHTADMLCQWSLTHRHTLTPTHKSTVSE